MFLEVLGIFYESVLFWALCLTAYFLLCVTLSAILYNFGEWSLNLTLLPNMVNAAIRTTKRRKCLNLSKKRLILILVLNALNLTFIVYGAVVSPGVSTYLLAIFVSNLLVYALYYIIMKLINKEKLTLLANLFAILSIICWIPGLYFFANSRTDSGVTPAQSRNLNRECMAFEMYDNHDIWHICSAAGLFFNFMMLIYLDEDLFYVPRAKIKIF